jgi:hypothetical protein
VPFTGGNAFFFAQTTDIKAMFKAGRGSVVTRGQDAFVFNQDCPYLAPQAGGSFGHKIGNVHKVFFP